MTRSKKEGRLSAPRVRKSGKNTGGLRDSHYISIPKPLSTRHKATKFITEENRSEYKRRSADDDRNVAMVRCIDLDEEETYEGEDRALTRWMYPYQDENGKERWSKECPVYVSPFVAWKRRLQEEREREEQAMSEMGMVRL